MRVERRKSARYCVRDPVFAVFTPEPARMVPIIDIGLGGLGVSVNRTGGSEHWLQSCSFLEIMAADGSFYLDNLPYELLPESTSTRTAGGLDFTAGGGKRQGREVPQSLRVEPDAKHPVRKTQSGNLNPNAVVPLQNHFYGVKFLNLTPSQKIHLKHLIRKHTQGGITPQFIRKFNQYFHQVLLKNQFGDSCQNIWLHRSAL